MKPYKEYVTLQQIIEDGWSRGFHYEQTLHEAEAMGFELSKITLEREWRRLDREMEAYFDDEDNE